MATKTTKVIRQGKHTEIVQCADGSFVVRDFTGWKLDTCDCLADAIAAFDSNEEQEAGDDHG